jgi:hypothetical protein
VLGAARLGSGVPSAATVLRGDGSWSALAAADIPALDAGKITTGQLATARLGSGVASSGRFLRGDGTWSDTSTAVMWASDFTSTSDPRLKRDVVTLQAAPTPLRPVRYQRIDTGVIEIGFIAPEVAESYPEAVHADDNGTLGVAYPRLTAALAAELAELRSTVAAQSAALHRLERRIAVLEAS